ncbi:MAG TPA: hypothetical protein VMV03_03095 [Spirochaetia bacterium]|nr:hypothetical protein [Spirochaetia bacterium]
MVANFLPSRRPGGPDPHANGGRGSRGQAVDITIILEDSPRGVPLSISSRWKKAVARVHALEGGLPAFTSLVASSAAETVVLASLSSVCVLDSASLFQKAASAGKQLAKVSVARTPLEMYVMRKDALLALLRSATSRPPVPGPLKETLFRSALFPSIDVIEDVEGDILFQNSLMEYYRRNMWVIANCGSSEYAGILGRLPELADKRAESHISEQGFIRNSWIASGVEIEGVVEDSIIFPNVQVRKDAVISRSLVLNGNRIGAGAELTNTLVMPLTAELPRSAANIGDGCSVGTRASIMKNAAYPDSIRDGLTVIGMNAEIPGGLRVEAAACIGPGVPASVLRKMKIVRKGMSVFPDRSADLQGAGGSPR